MTVYAAPLRDMHFVLEELVGFDAVATLPDRTGIDTETLTAILDEAGRFGAEVLAPLNRSGDEEGCRYENGAVATPAGFSDAYAAFAGGGWTGLACAPDHGGQGLPWLVATAVSEIWNAANVSFALCPTLTLGTVELLAAHGNDAQRQTYLPRLVSGEWCGAMALTEPQAGSDLGALTAKAEPDGDDFRISGQKIFISWGEHDMAENIIHMVLARLPGAAGGPKGISLFLVPKFLPGDDGKPGMRNDVRCLRIERKLGIHGSPTCTMAYGEGEGAVGFLVGEENRGLDCMFTMMNNARLAIGHQGLGIAERATQQAVAFARERIQGRDADTNAPTAIIGHGDVRRMLLTMKAKTEAMRALAYFAAVTVDLAAHHGEADVRAMQQARLGLLTPIVKAWCTDTAVEVASIGVQVHGGAGYIEETGAAQHLRDARITPIYEGTNGIQALDLVRRKLTRDDGLAARAMIEEMRQFDGEIKAVGGPAMAPIRAALADGGAALARATQWMAEANHDRPNAASAGAVPYLQLFGTVLGGYLMARSALIAERRLAAENGAESAEGDRNFYRAKFATALFYAESVLGGCTGLERAATSGAEAALALDEGSF
jgi:alkylation response protein AidB-like acyl-CoA dehydrogenase